VFLSARARVDGLVAGHLERALYEERSLVRMLGMRRTVFVVPRDLAAVMDAAVTRALAPAQRRRLVVELEKQGVAPDGAAFVEDVGDRVVAALAGGPLTANELRAIVPELRLRLGFGAGKSWEGTVGVSTRLLFLLATEGSIVRGRPRGNWNSAQFTWAATAAWLGCPLPVLDAAASRIELVRRYAIGYGPVTTDDVRWWTGWGLRATREAIAGAGLVEVAIADGPAYVAAGDVEPVLEPEPWVALLPALDPAVMGWRGRDFYLGPHGPALFDRNGNAGPTAWVDGRVVGTFLQGPDGSVAVRLLEDVGAAATAALQREAAALTAWLGDTVVKPRFPV
jgi:Winged helix DNA-binding domain